MRPAVVLVAVLALAACDTPQSLLQNAGTESARVSTLFWVMSAGAALIWLLTMALMVLAARSTIDPNRERIVVRRFVVAGLLWPLLTLTPLLVWGLSMLSDLRPTDADLRVAVSAERWWWRITYTDADGSIATANALHLPVGQRTAIELSSPDVIHSFWVPALAGKMDAIPGRRTELVLEPTRTGTFRGVCAEYCGSAHAQMAFDVHVVEPDAFEQWLRAQAAAASPPQSEAVRDGAHQFARNGCGGCHAIRGTEARGTIGPDLTHIASRASLGAGELRNDAAARQRLLVEPHRVKPGNRMPAFDHVPPAELEAIATYLGSLK